MQRQSSKVTHKVPETGAKRTIIIMYEAARCKKSEREVQKQKHYEEECCK